MKNKSFVVLFVCIILTTYCISCGSKTSTISVASIENEYTQDGKLNIAFWSALDSAAIKNIIQAFNDSQDKYHIQFIFKGSYAQTFEAGINALEIGQQPPLILLSSADIAMMISAKGIYKPADEILSKYANILPSSFEILPLIKSYYSENGKLQSFPFNVSTPIMIYNKDMLVSAGISLDEISTTFEGMEDMLQKLKSMGYVPMTASESGALFLETLSAMQNISFATYGNGLNNFKKSRIELSDLHLRTFEYLEDLGSRGLYKYYGRGNASEAQFVQGNVAIILAPSSILTAIKETKHLKYGIAYIPYFAEFTSEPKNSMIGGGSIWAFEGFSDEVYSGIAEFITFVYSNEMIFELHKNTGYIPITENAHGYIASQGYYNEPEEATPYIQLTKHFGNNSQGLRLGYLSKIRTLYDETLETLFRAKATPEDAFHNYETIANKFLSDFEFTN